MNRHATDIDSARYQTVYAKDLGSVAAPTAGLHFTEDLIQQIQQKKAKVAYVTLHVGSGTFKPVNVENISDHKMHSEVYNVSQETIDLIHETKKNGGKVVAVGTTSLRALETIAQQKFKTTTGETDIFITPGYKFQVVDKLITNFHLPKSTLLMLVSAFAGFEQIKRIYQHAIAHKYHFFSYGDAILLTLKIET
jgi:S-adenosylmethionine:tRNA ribosyltransferase-isomerase